MVSRPNNPLRFSPLINDKHKGFIFFKINVYYEKDCSINHILLWIKNLQKHNFFIVLLNNINLWHHSILIISFNY